MKKLIVLMMLLITSISIHTNEKTNLNFADFELPDNPYEGWNELTDDEQYAELVFMFNQAKIFKKAYDELQKEQEETEIDIDTSIEQIEENTKTLKQVRKVLVGFSVGAAATWDFTFQPGIMITSNFNLLLFEKFLISPQFIVQPYQNFYWGIGLSFGGYFKVKK